jgi:hypothetical protein
MEQEQGLELEQGTVKEQEESLEEAMKLGQEQEDYLGPDMDLEEVSQQQSQGFPRTGWDIGAIYKATFLVC